MRQSSGEKILQEFFSQKVTWASPEGPGVAGGEGGWEGCVQRRGLGRGVGQNVGRVKRLRRGLGEHHVAWGQSSHPTD